MQIHAVWFFFWFSSFDLRGRVIGNINEIVLKLIHAKCKHMLCGFFGLSVFDLRGRAIDEIVLNLIQAKCKYMLCRLLCLSAFNLRGRVIGEIVLNFPCSVQTSDGDLRCYFSGVSLNVKFVKC